MGLPELAYVPQHVGDFEEERHAGGKRVREYAHGGKSQERGVGEESEPV